MTDEVREKLEEFRRNLDGHEPRDFADPEPWTKKEDSPLYVDLSGLNAESNELGVITTFPMHNRRFKKSKYLDMSTPLTGEAKCRAMGHSVPGMEPDSKCKDCQKTRAELETSGELWSGKGPLR